MKRIHHTHYTYSTCIVQHTIYIDLGVMKLTHFETREPIRNAVMLNVKYVRVVSLILISSEYSNAIDKFENQLYSQRDDYTLHILGHFVLIPKLNSTCFRMLCHRVQTKNKLPQRPSKETPLFDVTFSAEQCLHTSLLQLVANLHRNSWILS